jgi:putative peptidoglycan lipid II flippase
MSLKLAKTAIIITIITLLSKVIGFLRDVLIANYYGTGNETDSFIMAQSVVTILSAVVLAALGTTLIPMLSDYYHTKDIRKTNSFINNVYTFSVLLTTVITIFGYIFAPSIITFFAPGYVGEVRKLTILLTRIILPSAVLSIIVLINNAILQKNEKYYITVSIGFIQNFVLIGAMLVFTYKYGIESIAYAFIIGTLFQILIQLYSMRSIEYRYKVEFDLKNEGLKNLFILVIPTIIGTSIQQVNTLIDRMIASTLPLGAVSALSFSNRLTLFVIGILAASTTTIFYSNMSKHISNNDEMSYKLLLKRTINILNMLVLPATFGLIILRYEIVKVVFERGLFDSSSTQITSIALLYYSIGLMGLILRDVFIRAFYSMKNTRIPMLNSILSITLNITLNIILVKSMGIGGLALASSISALFTTFLLGFSLYRLIGDFGIKEIIITFLKIILSNLSMTVIILIVGYFISNVYINLILSIVLGTLTYFIVLSYLKVKELDSIVNIFKNKFRKILRGEK